MCGIIGYIGKQNAVPMVSEGIKNLEYRGYDSCGIAVAGDHEIAVRKDIGFVDNVFSRFNVNGLSGNMAMAHTRWGTHGGITQENAHPHVSNDGSVVVIHNGIIENYQQLRRFLQDKGFRFYSQTDTEIIPNFIEYYSRSMPFAEAVKETLRQLEGSYAVVVMRKGSKELFAARKESPLVVGVADDGYFIASDIPAFLQHTKKVIYLHDMDFVKLDGKLEIFNLKTNLPVERKIDSIEWDLEAAKKGDFDHFMLKEIAEQTESIAKAIEQDRQNIDEVADAIRKAKGVYFVACGSSYHACKAAEYKFSSLAKRHVNIALASEFPSYKDFIIPESLVIADRKSVV